ncbi:MAG: hypothetical protein ACE5QV_06145 [Fidelibacterota bacterium]
MEEEAHEGHSLLDNQYCGQDNKTFQAIDSSIKERTSQFSSYKEGKIKDYGTGRCACGLDEEENKNYNQKTSNIIEKSISKW